MLQVTPVDNNADAGVSSMPLVYPFDRLRKTSYTAGMVRLIPRDSACYGSVQLIVLSTAFS